MRLYLVVVLSLIFIAPAVHGAGNLTVEATSLAPTYINTNTTTNMLNLSLNATVGTVNITALNITIVNLTVGNVTFVEVVNATGSAIASSYTFNSTTNVSTITIGDYGVTTSANKSLVVAMSLNRSAPLLTRVAVNISASTEIGVNTGSNVSITNTSLQSGYSQIQDLHANGTVSPLYVDTNIINQSMIYTFATDGRDSIYNISITVPTEYAIVNVTEVKQGSSILYNATTSVVTTTFNRTNGLVNLTNTASGGFSTSGDITVNISINSSSSALSAEKFNSTITGLNISGIEPNITGTNTSVATQQLINVTRVSISKGTALLNGTDYWEFNYTINFTANVTGTVQFKLTNWNDTENNTIALTNGSAANATHYATFRESTNSSLTMNVTNDYNITRGVSLTSCCTTTTVYHMVLKMMIPTGTPPSSTWYATYGIIFRAL